VRRLGFFLLFALLFSCAENQLQTRVYTIGENGLLLPAEKGEVILSKEPQLLKLSFPDSSSLENTAELYKLKPATKSTRLPPLTFVQFDFSNNGLTAWNINPSQIIFQDTHGRKFKAVSEKKYNERFTSVAYNRYEYKVFYASQITKRGKETPKDSFAFQSFSPFETISLQDGEAGSQILPFDFIPEGTESLTVIWADGKDAKKVTTFKISSERVK